MLLTDYHKEISVALKKHEKGDSLTNKECRLLERFSRFMIDTLAANKEYSLMTTRMCSVLHSVEGYIGWRKEAKKWREPKDV